MSLKDKVIFMSGGSRGIGLSIALRAAQDGAKVVIAAKTVDPHQNLKGPYLQQLRKLKKLVDKHCLYSVTFASRKAFKMQ